MLTSLLTFGVNFCPGHPWRHWKANGSVSLQDELLLPSDLESRIRITGPLVSTVSVITAIFLASGKANGSVGLLAKPREWPFWKLRAFGVL